MGVVNEATDAAKGVWRWLTPPVPGDPVADHKWRVKVVVSLLCLAGLQVLHLWSSSSWPWLGPNARADEVRRLEAKLDALIEQQTKTYVLQLGQEICRLYFVRMDPAPSSFVAQTLERSYEEKQSEYARLEGRRYPVAECQRATAPPSN